jgi:disulfide bond formation protein DsbB
MTITFTSLPAGIVAARGCLERAELARRPHNPTPPNGSSVFTEALTTFFALGAVVLLAVAVAVGLLWPAAARSARPAAWRASIAASVGPRHLTAAWLVAVAATAGSLYYSEIAGYAPCEFCWYQRIAMYPLALILGIAAFRRDTGVRRYALPLVGVGAALSTYHYLMQHFPDLSVSSCSASAPCTAAWVWEFGFVSIPFMALACFATIAWLLVAGREQAD